MMLVIAVIAGFFWGGSRYPTLNEKAIMGGGTQLEDPLAFMAVIHAQPSDPLYMKIAISTINWCAENQKGMTFGFLLGAGFLSLFSLFQKRGTNSAFLNTLIGIGTGAPLGVCVNCAAPIARGLHSSGARIETTLSAMFSSPTMNIVVLMMLFTLFPVYLIVIKLGLTLVFLLIAIPILSRTVFRNEAVDTYDDTSCPIDVPRFSPDEGWRDALKGAAATYGRNLWYILKMTLPLMLLAGMLGATVVNVMPLEDVADLPIGPLSVLGVAIFGLFLPLPIALDLVIAATLKAAGVPICYVGTLLFTLGIYSVYSLSIVWITLSARVALTLTVVLLVLGIVAGAASEHMHQRDVDQMLELLDEFS